MAAADLFRFYHFIQDRCECCDERCRRRRRYLRTLAFHGRSYRIPDRTDHEHDRTECAGSELRAGGHGRSDVGCDARTADRYLPDCRTDRRVSLVYAADDRFGDLISDDHALRTALVVRHASGAKGRAADP